MSTVAVSYTHAIRLRDVTGTTHWAKALVVGDVTIYLSAEEVDTLIEALGCVPVCPTCKR